MILMPGFDGTGELFSPLLAALSPHHRPAIVRYRDERTFSMTMLSQFCLDDRRDPALMNQALAAIRSMPVAAVAARLSVLADLQVRSLCRNVRTPILILRATNDRLVSPSRYKQLIDELPGAIVKAVEGPHLLLQSRPRECARLIDEFVSVSIR